MCSSRDDFDKNESAAPKVKIRPEQRKTLGKLENIKHISKDPLSKITHDRRNYSNMETEKPDESVCHINSNGNMKTKKRK